MGASGGVNARFVCFRRNERNKVHRLLKPPPRTLERAAAGQECERSQQRSCGARARARSMRTAPQCPMPAIGHRAIGWRFPSRAWPCSVPFVRPLFFIEIARWTKKSSRLVIEPVFREARNTALGGNTERTLITASAPPPPRDPYRHVLAMRPPRKARPFVS